MPRLTLNADQQVEITISNRTIFRVIAATIFALLFVVAVRHAAHTLTLIGAALFLSLALNAPVHAVEQRLPGELRGRRGFATGLSGVVVFVVLGSFLALVVPPLVKQTSSFIKDAPGVISQVHDQNSGLGHFVRQHHLEGEVSQLSDQFSKRVNNAGGTAVDTITRVGSSLFATLTVAVLTIMMIVEGPRWRGLLQQLTPSKHQARSKRLARDMYKVIKGYVNGQVFLAALASVLILPMLFILHISNPLALMVVVFICGLIPMVGHSIGAVIVTAVALFHSVTAAVFILGYYILYQQIENYVVQPRIQANATNMSALLVFTSVILGANFGGLLGALVAIPVAGCIRVAVLDYLAEKDILSKKTVKNEETPKKKRLV